MSQLGRVIQGELDARGPEKFLVNAFQLWKQTNKPKKAIDKHDTVKINSESDQEKVELRQSRRKVRT